MRVKQKKYVDGMQNMDRKCKHDNDDGDDDDDDGDGDDDDNDDDNDGGAAGFLRRVSIGFCPGSAEINLQKIVKSSPGGKSAEYFCFFLLLLIFFLFFLDSEILNVE